MLKESASVEWSSKIELAVHTGNVGSAYRKRLAEEARRSPNEILVNELYAPPPITRPRPSHGHARSPPRRYIT